VVDRDRLLEHRPFRRRLRQVRVLAQRNVVVVHAAIVVARVKAHLAVAPLRVRDLLEAEGLGPEFVRLLDIAHIDDEMIDAARSDRLVGRRWYDRGGGIRHLHAPLARDLRRLNIPGLRVICHRDHARLRDGWQYSVADHAGE